jgi:hypothetical protein
VTATQIGAAGQLVVTVQSTGPGGGTSNALQFEIDTAGTGATTAPAFSITTASIAAGATATYGVTLPASSTDVSATCLNLPTGATCSYSSSTGNLQIATTSNTPAGNWQITVIFIETLPGAATGILIPFFIAPMLAFKRGKRRRNNLLLAVLILIAAGSVTSITSCGGGTGTGTAPPSNPTHQVNSSGAITLQVH